MDSPARARTGTRLLQVAVLLLLCGFAVAWWFGLHQPWLRNRDPIRSAKFLTAVSVETTNVLPPSLAKIFGSSVPYFERVEVVRGGAGQVEHLHHLLWCDLRPDPFADEPGAFSFVDCPKLERIYLVGATSLQITDCPALQEVHLVNSSIGKEDLPPGVRVFINSEEVP